MYARLNALFKIAMKQSLWHLMLLDAAWYCLMTFDDVWWPLMTLNDAWWCLMMLDDAWWCLMMLDDAWWCLMTPYDTLFKTLLNWYDQLTDKWTDNANSRVSSRLKRFPAPGLKVFLGLQYYWKIAEAQVLMLCQGFSDFFYIFSLSICIFLVFEKNLVENNF